MDHPVTDPHQGQPKPPAVFSDPSDDEGHQAFVIDIGGVFPALLFDCFAPLVFGLEARRHTDPLHLAAKHQPEAMP